jgi:BirA family biotin operon repressor/biotin-[acetyl-CoA-carboxylase] ligase
MCFMVRAGILAEIAGSVYPRRLPRDFPAWHAFCILGYNERMLNEGTLRSRLPVRGLGAELRFLLATGSTNDAAAALAHDGAPHGTLVVAEEQTAGRGRAGSSWFTPPGSALALSLVIRPGPMKPEATGGLSALGALAVAEALELQGAAATIKWPNDVLLEGRKVAGVLVEGSWVGDELDYAIVGIGVNVRPASVPDDREVTFPATCVETVAGRSVDRQELLVDILEGVGRWLDRLGSEALRSAWEGRLAYLGAEVMILDEQGHAGMRGVVEGLGPDGRLRLRTDAGGVVLARPEGSHLRPVDRAGA